MFSEAIKKHPGIVIDDDGAITYEGKIIGRDAKMYDFMVEIMGFGQAAVFFISEVVVVLPYNHEFYEAMRKLGREYLGGQQLIKYLAIFE